MNPKIDYVFKRIFGYKGNEDITKDLLNSILDTKINTVSFETSNMLEKDLYDDKIGILDVTAKLYDNTECDIEMQIIDRKNIEKRILFYWSKMYQKTIVKGEDYDKLRKCIVVLFIDYELNTTKNIPEYLTKWNIREKKYPEHILLNDLEFCIIELPKYEKYKDKNNTLNTWLKFIINHGEIDMGKETNKAVKKAKKVLEEISQDARERELAELREKYIMDQKAIEAAGYDKGYDKGIEFGKIEEKKEIAKKLLKDNFNIEKIIELTGLTEEEILKL